MAGAAAADPGAPGVSLGNKRRPSKIGSRGELQEIDGAEGLVLKVNRGGGRPKSGRERLAGSEMNRSSEHQERRGTRDRAADHAPSPTHSDGRAVYVLMIAASTHGKGMGSKKAWHRVIYRGGLIMETHDNPLVVNAL